jgi:hypothetical protein
MAVSDEQKNFCRLKDQSIYFYSFFNLEDSYVSTYIYFKLKREKYVFSRYQRRSPREMKRILFYFYMH